MMNLYKNSICSLPSITRKKADGRSLFIANNFFRIKFVKISQTLNEFKHNEIKVVVFGVMQAETMCNGS